METNNYNSYGYLFSISADGETISTITGMNERQQVTAGNYGSSQRMYSTYGFDEYGYPSSSRGEISGVSLLDYRYLFEPVTGNLNMQQDNRHNRSESFGYENLDRLVTVSGPQNLSMDYDVKGNIVEKSDVGSMFEYNHPDKPYAITGIETSTGLVADSLSLYIRVDINLWKVQ